MKIKILCILIAIMLTFVCISASAESNSRIDKASEQETVYMKNGDYVVVEKTPANFKDDFSGDSSGDGSADGSPQAICYITESYYSKEHVLLWRYQLTAKYSINYGNSATCTKAYYQYKIYDDAWSFSHEDVYIKNNTAYGTANFTKKLAFITTESRDINLSIECDEYCNY